MNITIYPRDTLTESSCFRMPGGSSQTAEKLGTDADGQGQPMTRMDYNYTKHDSDGFGGLTNKNVDFKPL